MKKKERLRAPGSGLQVPAPEQLSFVFPPEEILDRVSGPFEKEIGRERPKR